MKRAVLYTRVSSVDQNPETQRCDLRPLAAARGYEIIGEYTDTISGSKAKRPGLDQLMADARRGRFDVVLVWAFDRVARSVKHFLEILDDLNHLNVEFVSFRENIDTGGPLGRAMVIIVGAIAELERSLIVERVKAFVDAKMDRADISVALYQVAADMGGPALIKRINQRSRKTVEAMLETASDIKSPPDKFAIDIMLSAMAGAMRSLLEAGPSPATVRKAREQLVLLCQSYMTAATAKRV